MIIRNPYVALTGVAIAGAGIACMVIGGFMDHTMSLTGPTLDYQNFCSWVSAAAIITGALSAPALLLSRDGEDPAKLLVVAIVSVIAVLAIFKVQGRIEPSDTMATASGFLLALNGGLLATMTRIRFRRRR